MGLEIERRYLVKGDEWKKLAGPAHHLRQCYLASSIDGWTIRVRIVNQQSAWLTLKKKACEMENHEFEYSIPMNDAESMWKLAKHKLTKTRYKLNIERGDWIVDCFEGENSPLVLAEVELNSNKEEVVAPAWCFQEITNKNEWSNAALAQSPISQWPKNEQLAHKWPYA